MADPGGVPLWTGGVASGESYYEAEKVRAGRKPFVYASDVPDSTKVALEEILKGRPDDFKRSEPKPDAPAPFEETSGEFEADVWERRMEALPILLP